MRPLLIVTRNKGKLPEITGMLAGLDLELLNLNDVPGLPENYEVEEPAATFEGNAIVKAMIMGRRAGLLTLADDSGLEVEALDGKPGVYSARYAPGTDEDRYRKLLAEMKDVPDGRRGARFRCVIAVYDPEQEKIRTCEGTCPGRILREPRGTGGFGYDPVFWHEGLSKTVAEMTMEEKNSVGHRGLAMRRARKMLQDDFNVPTLQ